MGDEKKLNDYVATVLQCLEMGCSLAASINPLFKLVLPVIKMSREAIKKGQGHPLDNNFQEIKSKIETISEKNRAVLIEIEVNEVNTKYGKYEQTLKYQYEEFNKMMANIKKDPENTTRYKEDFAKSYENSESFLSLNSYYDGVMGNTLFGGPMLEVYMKCYEWNHEKMKNRCLHVIHIFHMGLIARIAYAAVIGDDEEMIKNDLKKRMTEIDDKIEKVLSECENKHSSAS